MTEREAFLRRFHAARPGITASALGPESYDRLAAAVPRGARVLDLGCGDTRLLSRLGPRAIGLDLAPSRGQNAGGAIGETGSRGVGTPTALPAGRGSSPVGSIGEAGSRGVGTPTALPAGRGSSPVGSIVQGRAQAMPFAERAFDACVCHLAFMLFDDIARVVAELRRVVVPGGVFAAVLGGGPTAGDPGGPDGVDADDAFHRFLAIAAPRGPGFGDRRARTPAGWRELFGGAPGFERLELDLSGRFDDVWRFLGASYQLADAEAAAIRERLEAGYAGRATVPCRVVMWLATTRL